MTETALDDRGVIETCPKCGQKNRVLFSGLANTVRCGKCKEELPPLKGPIEISDESAFNSLIRSSPVPVLVDFWAPWCGPCKMMAPELKRVAENSGGKFLVAKVDTEAVPALSQRFQINAIPTLAVFSGGTESARTQGFRPASQIEKFVAGSIVSAAG
jgi:thioredoxin 2